MQVSVDLPRILSDVLSLLRACGYAAAFAALQAEAGPEVEDADLGDSEDAQFIREVCMNGRWNDIHMLLDTHPHASAHTHTHTPAPSHPHSHVHSPSRTPQRTHTEAGTPRLRPEDPLARARFAALRQEFLELFASTSEEPTDTGTPTDSWPGNAAQDGAGETRARADAGTDTPTHTRALRLVQLLQQAEKTCSRQEFNSLCFTLTLRRVSDHPHFADWSPMRGRWDVCLRVCELFHVAANSGAGPNGAEEDRPLHGGPAAAKPRRLHRGPLALVHAYARSAALSVVEQAAREPGCAHACIRALTHTGLNVNLGHDGSVSGIPKPTRGADDASPHVDGSRLADLVACAGAAAHTLARRGTEIDAGAHDSGSGNTDPGAHAAVTTLAPRTRDDVYVHVQRQASDEQELMRASLGALDLRASLALRRAASRTLTNVRGPEPGSRRLGGEDSSHVLDASMLEGSGSHPDASGFEVSEVVPEHAGLSATADRAWLDVLRQSAAAAALASSDVKEADADDAVDAAGDAARAVLARSGLIALDDFFPEAVRPGSAPGIAWEVPIAPGSRPSLPMTADGHIPLPRAEPQSGRNGRTAAGRPSTASPQRSRREWEARQSTRVRPATAASGPLDAGNRRLEPATRLQSPPSASRVHRAAAPLSPSSSAASPTRPFLQAGIQHDDEPRAHSQIQRPATASTPVRVAALLGAFDESEVPPSSGVASPQPSVHSPPRHVGTESSAFIATSFGDIRSGPPSRKGDTSRATPATATASPRVAEPARPATASASLRASTSSTGAGQPAAEAPAMSPASSASKSLRAIQSGTAISSTCIPSWLHSMLSRSGCPETLVREGFIPPESVPSLTVKPVAVFRESQPIRALEFAVPQHQDSPSIHPLVVGTNSRNVHVVNIPTADLPAGASPTSRGMASLSSAHTWRHFHLGSVYAVSTTAMPGTHSTWIASASNDTTLKVVGWRHAHDERASAPDPSLALSFSPGAGTLRDVAWLAAPSDVAGASTRPSAVFDPAAFRVATAGAGDFAVRVYSIETATPRSGGEPLVALHGHTDVVHAVSAWGVDGRQLVTASADGCVRLWDIRMARAAAAFALSDTGAASDDIFAGGARLPSVTTTISSAARAPVPLHALGVRTAAAHVMPRELLVGAVNGSVGVLDILSGRMLCSSRVHSAEVRAVRALGPLVLTASFDGTVAISAVCTSALATVTRVSASTSVSPAALQTLTVRGDHGDKVLNCRWLPSDTSSMFVTSSADKSVLVWELAEAE